MSAVAAFVSQQGRAELTAEWSDVSQSVCVSDKRTLVPGLMLMLDRAAALQLGQDLIAAAAAGR